MQASIQQMQARAQEIDELKAQIATQQKALDDFQKMANSSAPALPTSPAQVASATSPPAGASLFPTIDSSVVATSPTAQPAAAQDAIPTIDPTVVAAQRRAGRQSRSPAAEKPT